MPALSQVAALHGALWNIDPWYRRSWYVGPLSTALLVCGWIIAQPQQPARSADIPWAVPLPSARPTVWTPARAAIPGQGVLPPDVVRRFSPPGWTPPAKAADNDKPSEPVGAAQPAAPGVASPQKAALYEEDVTDPTGKRFEGTVNWFVEETAATADRPKEISIKAAIEVPGRGIKMTLSIRRNADTSLPASHLVELAVTLPPDFQGGGIASVLGIMAKPNEQAKGLPLAAIAVKAYDGLFLIGLSNNDSERYRNMHLLEDNAWIDIPVVYNNQRRAILAVEKGVNGQRVFRQALAAWLQ